MENNLTVVIPFYLENEHAKKLIKLVKKKMGKYPNLLLINDKYDTSKYFDEILTIKNNEQNYGKFWSIFKSLGEIKTDYFLTIDPDDIFLNNIKWKNIFRLEKDISTKPDHFDIGINTYTIIKEGKKRKILSENCLTYFNPNTIYNRKNILENSKFIGINFSGKKLSYFEDVLLLILSYSNGKIEYFDWDFYTYLKDNGMTNNPEDYVNEIIEAKILIDMICAKIDIKSRLIIEKRISRVNNIYDKFS